MGCGIQCAFRMTLESRTPSSVYFTAALQKRRTGSAVSHRCMPAQCPNARPSSQCKPTICNRWHLRSVCCGCSKASKPIPPKSIHRPPRGVSCGHDPLENLHPGPSSDLASFRGSLEVELGTLYSRGVALARHASLTRSHHAVLRVSPG